MANRINLTKVQGGPRYLIYRLFIASDGAGDIEDLVLIDPVDIDMGVNKRFSIEDVTWAFNGFTGNLYFEELVDDTYVWVLPQDSCNYVDFGPYGGLLDTSTVDGTHRLMFSTRGFDSVGRTGSLLIKVRLHS